MSSEQFTRLILDTFLPYRLSIVNNKIRHALSSTYSRQFDLSPIEWRVLAVLGQNEKMSADEICRFTETDKVAVSRAVSKLLGKKRISRKRSSFDRRRSILRLTEHGLSIYESIVPRVLQLEDRLVEGLSQRERREFCKLLGKIERQLSALKISPKF